MKKIISLIIVCTIIISGMFMYNKNDKKDLLEDSSGPIIAAVIDGKASTSFPTTDKYVAIVECTRNGVKQDVGAKVVWNGTKWVVSFDDISAGNVRCNVNFRELNFAETIFANNEVKAPITTPGTAISTADEALLASAEDDYGTSYYFRGAVTNNYVEFANKCWRIVRIVGDGSVKLVLHNDNTNGMVNPCGSANNNASAAFARYSGATYTSKFNENKDDNAYVGFMYGTVDAGDYAATHANTNKSTILTNLENWYNNNLKAYESVIDDNIWCTDKTNITDISYNPWSYGKKPTGLGYGTNKTYYGATQRLVSSSGSAGGTGPSLKCNGELSKIKSKIGLLTADEVVYAGYAYGLNNGTTYLQENATDGLLWTLSPVNFSPIGRAHVWRAGGKAGSFDHDSVSDEGNVRPSIFLKPSTSVTGDGTSEKPYVVN